MIDYASRQVKAAVREFVDIETILAAHADAGTEGLLLCPWVSLLRYDAPADEALRSCRIQNEALSRLAQTYPRQLRALGVVPLQDPELAARELEELMLLPGLHGVEIAASVRGAYLGDDRFRPFWDVAEATGALVFIHPTTRGFDHPVFNEYYLEHGRQPDGDDHHRSAYGYGRGDGGAPAAQGAALARRRRHPEPARPPAAGALVPAPGAGAADRARR